MFFIEKLKKHFCQQVNIVMERRKLCDGTDVLFHTFFPGPRFFFFFLYVCGGVVGVRFK